MEDKRLAGMTINERLAELDLFDDWDAALEARDTAEMKKILCRCDLGEEFADMTIKAVLNQ